MGDVDWDNVRRHRFSDDRPEGWPDGVKGISMNGLNLFGIHQKTGALYWDGREIVLRRTFRLGTFERWIASIAALGTFGTFAINFIRLYWSG